MDKIRLDLALFEAGLTSSRSQAENYIKLGLVSIGNKIITKSGTLVNVSELTGLKINIQQQYVSRAALKLDSVIEKFNIAFKDKVVLDVGSSTGGFTQLAILKGARKVIAVEKGSDQLHESLRSNRAIELHEKTDIRDFKTKDNIDLVVIDVSFVSLRDILPAIYKLSNKETSILAMVKPQFEAINANFKHKGVIKNEKIRRVILKDFENWVAADFVVINKADSQVAGAKGNHERFYLLKKV